MTPKARPQGPRHDTEAHDPNPMDATVEWLQLTIHGTAEPVHTTKAHEASTEENNR